MDVRYLLAGLLGAVVLTGDGACKSAGGRSGRRSEPGGARGSYLAKAADCMPCHTSARDKPYAGGLRMNTPFGAIYSPNITPDRDTGIGAWTFDQFRRPCTPGFAPTAKYLYPAMPFDAFTMISGG